MKNALIKGTIILTISTLITRILGFVYKAVLSSTFGAESIGVYQLTLTILSITMALSAFGLQTSLSTFVAKDKSFSLSFLISACIMTTIVSGIISLMLYNHSSFIAKYLLLQPQCDSLIKLLSLSVPLSSLHCVISGFYYGQKKTGIPAFSTFIEQIVRVSVILYFSGTDSSIELAMYAMLAGEMAATLVCLVAILIRNKLKCPNLIKCSYQLFTSSLPLTFNRTLLSLLQSAEMILIPSQLQLYSLSESDALTQFGLLTGMALPFVLLPTIISNSTALLLVPTVSKADSDNNNSIISKAIQSAISLSLIAGILFTVFFLFYGKYIAAILFDNPMLFPFIENLAWLSPLLFLGPSLTSILNGLQKTKTTATISTIGIAIRLFFIVFAIPSFGIQGYMIGILISQLVVCCLSIKICCSMHQLSFSPYQAIIKPILRILISMSFVQLFQIIFTQLFQSLTQSLLYYILSSVVLLCAYVLLSLKQLRKLLAP